MSPDALQAVLGLSGMAERDMIFREGSAMATALRLAESRPWPSAEMLGDVWNWALWLVMVRGYRGQTTGARYVAEAMRWGAHCEAHGIDYKNAAIHELDSYAKILYASARLSASARSVAVVALRSFYGWRASRRGGRHCAMELRVPKRPRRLAKKYTSGQLRALFAAVDETKNQHERIRDRAVLLLLYASGIRREECCTLRLADVMIESTRLATMKVHGKGAKERQVSVEGPVVSALAEWLELRRETPRLAHAAELFCSVKPAHCGRPLQPTGLERIVKRVAQRAKVSPWGVHMFRVTFATQLYDDGVDLERIRIALGHESIETTRGYLAVSARQRQVRLPSHRQFSALGKAPDGLPAWAKKLEQKRP